MAKFISVIGDKHGNHRTFEIPDDKLQHYKTAAWMSDFIQVDEKVKETPRDTIKQEPPAYFDPVNDEPIEAPVEEVKKKRGRKAKPNN